MKTEELISIVRTKIDELYPNYNSSSVFSISKLENPVESYIKKLLSSCILQLVKDAPLEKLYSVMGEWAIVPDDEACFIYGVRQGHGEPLPYVVSFDSTDAGLRIQIVSTIVGSEYNIKIIGRAVTGVRNILLSNGLFFRNVWDGFEAKGQTFYLTYFPNGYRYLFDHGSNFTDLVVPGDYARFVSINIKEGVRPISGLSEYPSEFYKMQFSSAANKYVRPVAFHVEKKNIRVFPPGTINEFKYIPIYIPEEVPPILIDAYTWLCAGQVLATMNATTSTSAMNFYKIAL